MFAESPGLGQGAVFTFYFPLVVPAPPPEPPGGAAAVGGTSSAEARVFSPPTGEPLSRAALPSGAPREPTAATAASSSGDEGSSGGSGEPQAAAAAAPKGELSDNAALRSTNAAEATDHGVGAATLWKALPRLTTCAGRGALDAAEEGQRAAASHHHLSKDAMASLTALPQSKGLLAALLPQAAERVAALPQNGGGGCSVAVVSAAAPPTPVAEEGALRLRGGNNSRAPSDGATGTPAAPAAGSRGSLLLAEDDRLSMVC